FIVLCKYIFGLLASSLLSDYLFFYSYPDHRDLHSFPTRRSSDLKCKWSARAFQIYLYAYFEGRLSLVEYLKTEIFYRKLFLINLDRKSTRLNSSHVKISYAVFCLKKINIEESPIITKIQGHFAVF